MEGGRHPRIEELEEEGRRRKRVERAISKEEW